MGSDGGPASCRPEKRGLFGVLFDDVLDHHVTTVTEVNNTTAAIEANVR